MYFEQKEWFEQLICIKRKNSWYFLGQSTASSSESAEMRSQILVLVSLDFYRPTKEQKQTTTNEQNKNKKISKKR